MTKYLTPHAVITRALRGRGLKQGVDFTVHQRKLRGKPIGVRVYLQNPESEKLVTEQKNDILDETALSGFSFGATTHYTSTGEPLVDLWYMY